MKEVVAHKSRQRNNIACCPLSQNLSRYDPGFRPSDSPTDVAPVHPSYDSQLDISLSLSLSLSVGRPPFEDTAKSCAEIINTGFLGVLCSRMHFNMRAAAVILRMDPPRQYGGALAEMRLGDEFWRWEAEDGILLDGCRSVGCQSTTAHTTSRAMSLLDPSPRRP